MREMNRSQWQMPMSYDTISKMDPLKNSINIRSILVEIQHGVEEFYKNGHKTIIDLGSIPLTPIERIKLFKLLGQGEVYIRVSSLGETEIYETLLSAVWVVKHRDEQGNFNAMFIEVSKIPDIVLSQADDISTTKKELQELIDIL